MNQEFTIGPFKLIEDDEGFGVAQIGPDGIGQVIASFMYGPDCLAYFTSCVNDYLVTGKTKGALYEIPKEDNQNS